MGSTIIDFQGFRGYKNDFIIKELAISYNQREFQNFLIKPPYEFQNLPIQQQKQAKWLFHNHHGLMWNEGSINFDSLKEFLNSNLKFTTIYVKGHEKKVILNKLLNENATVIDLDELGAPNLENLRKKYSHTMRCSTHDGFCALQNALILRNYTNEMLSTNFKK